MKFVAEFDTMEEFQVFLDFVQSQKAGDSAGAKKPVASPAPAEKEAPKTGAKKTGKAAKAPADDYMNVPEDDGDDALPFGDDKGDKPPGDDGEKKVSESDVKLLLSKKLKAGKKEAVKELFAKYGVEKLSELVEKHADQLGAFYADAEVI